MHSRVRSAGRKRSGGPPPVFAGVDREAHARKRPRSSGGQLEVLGERCRLFEDGGGVAAAVEAGEHLLPCFGDEGTTVDRFDARLLLAAAPAAVSGGRGGGGAAAAGTAAADFTDQEAELDAERYRDLWPGGGASGSEDENVDSDRGELRCPPERRAVCPACIPMGSIRNAHSASFDHKARPGLKQTSSQADMVLFLRMPGGAAIPHDYGGGGGAGPSFQQVAFSYEQQPDKSAASTVAAEQAGQPAADEQQGEPFVAPFEVPPSLQGNLPTTTQQHQARTSHHKRRHVS